MRGKLAVRGSFCVPSRMTVGFAKPCNCICDDGAAVARLYPRWTIMYITTSSYLAPKKERRLRGKRQA